MSFFELTYDVLVYFCLIFLLFCKLPSLVVWQRYAMRFPLLGLYKRSDYSTRLCWGMFWLLFHTERHFLVTGKTQSSSHTRVLFGLVGGIHHYLTTHLGWVVKLLQFVRFTGLCFNILGWMVSASQREKGTYLQKFYLFVERRPPRNRNPCLPKAYSQGKKIQSSRQSAYVLWGPFRTWKLLPSDREYYRPEGSLS